MAGALLITGSSGIAEATALLAAQTGVPVFLVGLSETDCRALAGRIPECDYLAGDLREEAVSEQAVERCVGRFGEVAGLFNVAGISGRRFGDGPLHECSMDGWNATMDSNVRTTYLMSRAVLRTWMKDGRKGAIVNMASVLAFAPEPEHFATHAYAASKGAIVSLTLAMASYYAPHGIRVNAVAPGLVRTPMSARVQQDESILGFLAAKQPLSGGMLEAGDVAEAALFLLSHRSRHITGTVLTVDGGWRVS